MKNNKDNLIIWDYPKKKPIKLVFSELILWRDFSKKKNIVSIPILTEKWSDEIRKEYLDWIYNLGIYRIGRKSLIEILKIRNTFSACWFGLIVEKSNSSKSIYINSTELAISEALGLIKSTDRLLLASNPYSARNKNFSKWDGATPP